MDAVGLAPGVDAVQAEVATHAGADGVLAADHDLAHDVRVGHVGAGHTHHVELARGNGKAGGGHILYFGGVEDRNIHLRPDAAGKVQVRRAGHALHRDHVGQAGVGVDVAADDVQKIHHARLGQVARNAQAFLGINASGHGLVGHASHPQDEVGPHPGPDGLDHVQREAHPVFHGSAIRTFERVGGGGPELVHQVAIGFEFHAIDAGCVHALGRVGVVADQARDVPVFHLFGESAVRGLALVRGRDHRQPVGLGPAGAPPQVGDLDHHRGAVLVAGVGQVAHPGHHLVLVGQDVVEHRRAVARDGGRAGGHGQGNTGFGALHMVGAVAGFGQAVFGIGRLVRAGHDAVAQPQVLELKGLQQGVVGE